MKQDTCKTWWTALTYSITAVSILATGATATASFSLSTPKHSTKQSKRKTAITIHRATAMNSTPTVIPGVDTLTTAQAQQSALLAKSGQEALAKGHLSEAEIEFRQSLEIDSSNTDALVSLAQALEQENKGQQAIPVYRYLLYSKQSWGTSLEQDPILRMHFAQLLAGDNQWPEAVSVYESTISKVRTGPSYPSLDVHFSPETAEPALFQAMAHLAMGVIYNGRLDHAKALAEYEAALSAQPNLALAHYWHGYGLQRLGRRTEAQAAFAKAASLGEGDVKKAAQSPNGLLP